MSSNRANTVKFASIKAAITRFDKAAQEYARIGAQDPMDFEAIENEHVDSRASLEWLIEKVIP